MEAGFFGNGIYKRRILQLLDGADNYPPTRVLAWDPAQAPIPGRVFTTYAAARIYALSLSPTGSNGVKIIAPAGLVSENIVLEGNVPVHGQGVNATNFTGTITSNITGADVFSSGIHDCAIGDLQGTTAKYIMTTNSLIYGGTQAAGSILIKLQGVLTIGGDFTAVTSFPIYFDYVAGGDFTTTTVFNHATVNANLGAVINLTGGIFNDCILGAATLGVGTYTFRGGVCTRATFAVPATSTVTFKNVDFNGTTISYDSTTDTVTVEDCTNYTLNDTSTTWTNNTMPDRSYIKEWIFSFTDFSTAALTNTLTLDALPGEAIIEWTTNRTATAFGGGGITAYGIEIGVTGINNAVATSYDAFAPASNINFQSANVNSMFNLNLVNITITATSIGANLDQANAGQLVVRAKITLIS